MSQGQRSDYDIVVLGAGVLGLSVAQELTGKGVKVAIIAKDLPEDKESTGFASPWAGANWHSFAGDNLKERERDIKTFKRFEELSKKIPGIVCRTPYIYFGDGVGEFPVPWYKDLVFEYRNLQPHELPENLGITNGISFTSYTINPPDYIAYLASNLRSLGVPIIRHRLSSLDEAYSILGNVNLIINCTGLGSKTLLGVEDTKVFPSRGQTVLIQAKSIRTCIGYRKTSPKPGESTVIIPRPGIDGYSILGGTFLSNVYNTLPDPVVAQRILREAFDICPSLAEGGGGWKDIKVVAHNVGLRPCRIGGLRLELEIRRIGEGLDGREGLVPLRARGRWGEVVGVVHAYGIGPAGFQASLGIAEEVTTLALGFLDKQSLAKL